MKRYAYYPGCSLEKVALSYHLSTLTTMRQLGVELQELDDWNCCGTSTYFHVDELLAHTLVARNLALAEKTGLTDMVAPCSGCYKNTFFANADLQRDPDLAEHINYALAEDNLHYSGDIVVRHLIDVYCQDIGLEAIRRQVSHPLKDLRVAPYYGCQIVRPRKGHENVERPIFFEDLLAALGAEPVDYPSRLLCCGGSLIIASRKPALSLLRQLLQDAIDRQATVIATACPMCQVNLECYQQQVNQEYGTTFNVPVLYFTQLIGLAFGIAPKDLGFGSELVTVADVLARVRAV